MWDEISLNLPATGNVHAMLERIQKVVVAETEKNAELAEQEWKRGARGSSLSRFSATAGRESSAVGFGDRGPGSLCYARVGAV